MNWCAAPAASQSCSRLSFPLRETAGATKYDQTRAGQAVGVGAAAAGDAARKFGRLQQGTAVSRRRPGSGVVAAHSAPFRRGRRERCVARMAGGRPAGPGAWDFRRLPHRGAPAGPIRLLEFTGYSNPERAAGLNRLGLIRETSRGERNAIRESSYFGVMTASPEESAAEAHKALQSTATEAAYTAIRGRIAGGQVETATAHFTGPARLSPDRRNELFARAEQALSTAPKKPPEFRANGPIPALFLHALADALRTPELGQTQYVYNGRLYRLWVRHTADPRTAAYFRERGIIRAGAGVVRVAGKVRREAGGKETEFRLWIEEGAAQPVPLRIDFQPKSYLRLVFEAEV